MFSISVAFLIFGGTSINLQIQLIKDFQAKFIGADMAVVAALLDQKSLDEYNMRNYLDNYMKNFPNSISSYTFVTQPTTYDKKFWIQNLSELPYYKTSVVGIDENFSKTINQKFLLTTQFDSTMKFKKLTVDQKDPFSGLFTDVGIPPNYVNYDKQKITSNQQFYTSFEEKVQVIKLIAPEGVRVVGSLDVDTPGLLQFDDSQVENDIRLLTRFRAMCSAIPGLIFSKYQFVVFAMTLVTSNQQLAFLKEQYENAKFIRNGVFPLEKVQQPANLTFNLNKQRLMIKFKTKLDKNERVIIANGLRTFFSSDSTQLLDTQTVQDSLDDVLILLTYFLYLITIIAMIISFYLIQVSFWSNIKENSWEFGILRALGLNKIQMIKIYVYEALVLIITAGILGTIVGIVTAITISVQLVQFTELTFQFDFPFASFFLIFIFGFMTATLASYYAVNLFIHKSISSIVRGSV